MNLTPLTAARGFDGYKGHIAEDPDSEIITDTIVTAGNASDGSVAEDLIADLLNNDADTDRDAEPADADVETDDTEPADAEEPTVYGDAAYGTGEFRQRLDDADIDSKCRTQPPAKPKDRYSKDRFTIDIETDTVTCHTSVRAGLRPRPSATAIASSAIACGTVTSIWNLP